MSKKDARVDAYIRKSAPFAQPILKHLRSVVHAASPEIEEAMKWGFPHFMYKGMLCGMAAFKAHAMLGFWKGPLVVPKGESDDEFRNFGHLKTVSDLPSKKVLTGYIKKAMALNDEGVTLKREPRKAAKPTAMPKDLSAALAKNKKAKETFDDFSPSHKREYVEWITQAKQEDTRDRRVKKAIAQMADNKPLNWKYM